MLNKDWIKSWIRGSAWIAALLLPALASTAGAQTIPSIVVSSATTINNSGMSSPGKVAQDSCGNLYELEAGGNLLEIPANGGSSIYLANYGGSYAGDSQVAGLAIDSSNNLYVGNKWNGDAIKIPSSNCVPNPSLATPVLGSALNNLDGYWYDPGDVVVDGKGNLYVSSDGFYAPGSSGQIFEQTSAGVGVLVMASNGIPQVESLAVDAAGDVFFTTYQSGTVYEVAAANFGTSSPTAVITSGLKTAYGLAFDAAGNLYIGDSTAGAIYEVPFTTSLQFSKIYLVASGIPLGNPLSLAKDGKTILYTSGTNSSIYEQVVGGANFGSVAVGSSGTATVNVAFNAAVQPASIAFSANSAFVSTGGTCAGGTKYVAGNGCTITAKFAPATPGLASGGIVLNNATGAALATAYLEGTGTGAGLTLDTGALSSVGGGFTTPTSVALDGAGNSYFADSGANAVLEFAPGATKGVSIGTGLSKPTGVAVDGAGNVIIADTGNNQIVEVPVVNGKLSNAAQFAIVTASTTSNGVVTPTLVAGSALSNPAGVTVDALGNLYIADTGNNRVVYLPYNGSWNLALASALGSGLSAPLATTVDASGNAYVASSGSGQIYRFPAPLASGVQQLVAVGYSKPSALATDASGSLFVVDQGNGNVIRIPSLNGTLNPNVAVEVGIGNSSPYGLAADSFGNLYVADSTAAAAHLITRTAITESFGDWAVGSPSGPLPVKVENSGNQALVFASPFSTASGNTADFSLSSSPASECANGASIAVGAGCELDATFQPTASGTRTETLVLNSNAANAAAPQVILTGVGAAEVKTASALAITSPSNGTPFFGQPITLTATVSSSSGTPGGAAQLLVDGVVTAQASLSSGVATFTLATGLTGGSHSLQAVYLGSSTFDGSTSSTLSLAVSTAPTASAMAITAPYIQPYSAVVGASVTFTVAVGSTGVGIPTGTVTFTTGGKSLGSAPLAPAAGGGFQAALSTTALPVGVDVVTATYSGDANYVGSSTSGTVTIVSGPTVTVTSGGTTLSSSDSFQTSLTFTNTSYGGWQGVVGYQCVASTLPVNAICVFSPGQVTVTPSTAGVTYPAATTTLKVVVDNPPNSPAQGSMLWWVGGLSGLMLFWMRRRMMRGVWANLTMMAGAVLIAIAATGLTACGNSIPYATPAGSSTITVLASSDPYATGVTNATQPCVNATSGATGPTQGPCTQQSYQISLTVQ
jgi:sugar lactone lactonase YvrE